MINTQQIIVLMPLFNIEIPANAQMFFGFVMQLASFNILPMQDFYQKYLPAPNWDAPVNERFNVLGFQSVFFLTNMGSMVIGLAMIPLLSCLLLMMKPFARLSKRFAALKNKIHSSLFWSQQITLMNESFSMICMCAFINARHITFDSKCEVINSVLTIAFLVICIALPLVVGLFLMVQMPKLASPTMQIKYGELTQGLNLEKGRFIALTPVNFLLRRFMLVAMVVFFDYLIP